MSAISKGAIFASLAWSGVSRGALAVAEFRSSARLLLNFLSGTLDPRITFSRGTNATRIDSTGRLTYAPANLLQQSGNISAAPWESSNQGAALAPTVTGNAGTAPDETTTATRLQLSLGGGTATGDIVRRRQMITFSPVQHIFSIWIRSTDGSSNFNIHLQDPGGSTQNITVTGSWVRYVVSGVGPTGTGYVSVGLRGGQTPANSATADILVWGGQLEPVTYQTTPSTYVATTSAAYYGPRFDYDPVTLAPRGLLIEEARTNLALYSDDFGNAAWAKTAATITANATSSPDGTTNADKLVATAVTSGHFVSQAVTITASTNYTVSVYVKAAEYSWAIIYVGTVGVGQYVNLATGAVGSTFIGAPTSTTVTNAGNGWRRVNMVFSSGVNTSADVRVYATTADGTSSYLGDGTSGIYVWGADLEAGSFATSYIPTVASTVTRNADVAAMTGTNFSSWYNQSEGTFVVGYDQLSAVNSDIFMAASAGPSFNPGSVGIFGTNTSIQGYVRASSAYTAQVTSTSTLGNNVPLVAGIAYKVNDVAATVMGVTPIVATPPNAMPTTVVQLNIMGAGVTGTAKSGHIRTIAYFNTRLPNAQLQTLTAPSLATTLHVDFTSGSYLVGF